VGIFWVLVACCIRVIIYLKVHPAIAGCTRTFEICFWELVNFFFSFGIIFVFLAFIAYTQCEPIHTCVALTLGVRTMLFWCSRRNNDCSA
jgi:hypothetical protein